MCGRAPEGASRFRRRAAMRRGSWEIAVEDAVGEPPRADGPLKSLHAGRAGGLTMSRIPSDMWLVK